MKIKFEKKFDRKITLCLGLFDAVHIGHRTLIENAKEVSKGSTVAFFVFDDGYGRLFKGNKQIYSLRERMRLLTSLCPSCLIIEVGFDENFIRTLPMDFIKKLDSLYDISDIVVGKDYTFGYEGKGNVETLKAYFKGKDTKIHVVDTVCVGSEKVSSTKIRCLIQDGRVDEAASLLGEPFHIKGRVEQGRKQGSKIGIPTANIALDENLIYPKEGVYVTKTKVDGKLYPSVTNVGAHPTYSDFKKNAETHIMGKFKELYGKEITVYFYKKIRDIYKFASKEDLYAQIEKDKAFALQTLEERNK